MNDKLKAEIALFNKEKVEALQSLDEQKIRAFHQKYNGHDLPDNPLVFWGSVHKAITGCVTLPLELRKKSKAWLDERGWQSLDDGDL